jgi:hypothetical protein
MAEKKDENKDKKETDYSRKVFKRAKFSAPKPIEKYKKTEKK